ncbi:hypothetical protein PoB_001852100 [Plakobranchus ocellatus]|uniref:Uncharacterized protein n=1 Tax=Plakobranchus ocellatus TaxID=259542 RepID=A0AAV3YY52_9GAST|nr:hypothetical protein PoB_001852100 [Plakobranchus ocellatus]
MAEDKDDYGQEVRKYLQLPVTDSQAHEDDDEINGFGSRDSHVLTTETIIITRVAIDNVFVGAADNGDDDDGGSDDDDRDVDDCEDGNDNIMMMATMVSKMMMMMRRIEMMIMVTILLPLLLLSLCCGS